jgi:hypothetical protein
MYCTTKFATLFVMHPLKCTLASVVKVNLRHSVTGKLITRTCLPPESYEISVHGDVIHYPVSKRDFTYVDVQATADRILDAQVLELFIKKSESNQYSEMMLSAESNLM